MAVLLLVVIVCSVAGIFLSLFMLLRNQAVYEVRGAFIEAADFPLGYEKLPSYDEMLYHPRHLLRWTVTHWRAYIGA